MPVTLHYFDIAGKASALRMAMRMAKMDFVDKRIPREEWMSVKPKYPLGQLPVLELEDGYQLCQANAILEYVADKAGMTPSCPVAAAKVRSVLECVWDCYMPIVEWMRTNDPKAKEACVPEKKKACEDRLAMLDKMLAKTEKNGYVLGDHGKDTAADLLIADFTFAPPYAELPVVILDAIKSDAPTMLKIAQRFRKDHEQLFKDAKPTYKSI